jgi:hypothetical protein
LEFSNNDYIKSGGQAGCVKRATLHD